LSQGRNCGCAKRTMWCTLYRMVEVVTNRNCVYQTAYHVIWCPKYQRDVLTGTVAEETGAMLDAICMERGWPVISKEIQPDHIHLFVSIPPAIAVADAVKVLKGVTARRLFQTFPALKKRLWGGSLWSPSYYVGTAGNVSAETIRCYIERSEHVTKRR
jgi:putative transposase